MYKLMLVEDEEIVRESMIQNIVWEQYGFQLSGACRNGQEALEQVPLLLPDVVVTDICMPLVDGLELARYLREHYPSIFVVILTGFSEFSYAQQAVQLRVHDFILKPVVPREFCAILAKLSAELQTRDSHRSSMRSLQSRANQAEAILRSSVFRHILRASMTSEEVRIAAERAGLRLDCAVYCALFCQAQHISQSITEAQRLQDAVQEVAVRFPNCTGALLDDRYAVLLIGGRTQEEVTGRSRDAADMLANAVSRACGVPAVAGVGTCCCSLSGLHRCFQEAFHALGYGFSTGQKVVVDRLALAAERPVTAGHPLPGEQSIVQALQTRSEAAVEDRLNDLFDEMRRRSLHLSACVPVLERLRFALTDLIPRDSLRAASHIPPAEQWFRIEELHQAYAQLAAFVLRCLKPQEEDPAQRCVESAKGYILQHYHDSEFSLSELLSLLNVSKSYFSAVFKAQTGQTFIEYLTSLRMDKARCLLATTNLCTYEIAERIGFTDPHYFSVTFKRYVGKTPREYRESAL